MEFKLSGYQLKQILLKAIQGKKDLRLSKLSVLTELIGPVDASGVTRKSMATIASKLHIDVWTVKNAISWLKKNGYISLISRGNNIDRRSNVYQLNLAALGFYTIYTTVDKHRRNSHPTYINNKYIYTNIKPPRGKTLFSNSDVRYNSPIRRELWKEQDKQHLENLMKRAQTQMTFKQAFTNAKNHPDFAARRVDTFKPIGDVYKGLQERETLKPHSTAIHEQKLNQDDSMSVKHQIPTDELFKNMPAGLANALTRVKGGIDKRTAEGKTCADETDVYLGKTYERHRGLQKEAGLCHSDLGSQPNAREYGGEKARD
jgi:hypothetical protein